MAIWPEERLRDHVEAAGGRARVDAAALLRAFSVRQPTPEAGENVRQWLAGVGVTMEPPVLAPDGEVTLAIASGSPATANGAAAQASSLDDLERMRRPSVLAYASRLCPPERIADAVGAAFADFRGRLASDPATDVDAALLEATRDAVAARTAPIEVPSRAARLVAKRPGATCEAIPKLLAARASARLGERDREAVTRHLSRCLGCRTLEHRRDEAERAYHALTGSEPAPKLDDLAAMPAAASRPDGPALDAGERHDVDEPNGVPPGTAEPELWAPDLATRAAPAPEPEEPAVADQARPPADPPRDRDAADATPAPRRSPWTRRIAVAVFLIGLLLAIDAVLTVTWKEPVSAFLQARDQNDLEEELADEEESVGGLSTSQEAEISRLTSSQERREKRLSYYARNFSRRVREGQAIGRLRVEGVGEWVVVHGTNAPDLRKAPGHYKETVMPGQRGTVAVAGHRTTYGAPFRHLDKLKPRDTMTFTMPYGRFTYRVQGTKIVPAGESDATRRVSYNRLVLTACHPLHSSAQRILVFARLEKKEPLGVAAKDEGPAAGESPEDRRAAARVRARKRLKLLGKRLLGPGMKGRDVKTLQRLLGVPQTGTYDALTEYAVRDFQQKHKLAADGRAGAATKRRLARRPRPPSRPPTPPAVAPVPPKDSDGDGRPDQPGQNGQPGQPGQPPVPGQLPPGQYPGAGGQSGQQGPPGAYAPPAGSGQ